VTSGRSDLSSIRRSNVDSVSRKRSQSTIDLIQDSNWSHPTRLTIFLNMSSGITGKGGRFFFYILISFVGRFREPIGINNCFLLNLFSLKNTFLYGFSGNFFNSKMANINIYINPVA